MKISENLNYNLTIVAAIDIQEFSPRSGIISVQMLMTTGLYRSNTAVLFMLWYKAED
ncbi:MAG: hypothetical protein SWZ49_06765 [Cyanobacteriota bacterium]|nr:hypothetical protein [Cyanobacteriota bacterium]